MKNHQQIRVRKQEGGEENVSVAETPDRCPICHVAVTPTDLKLALPIQSMTMERLFQCPNQSCNRIFIGRYSKQPQSSVYFLRTCVPVEPKPFIQSEAISKISPDFCAIYEEAHKAEQSQLLLVAGPGYRKALEFLIKDYIIGQIKETDESKRADEKRKIEKTLLGNCINLYIKSEQIKEVAKRAAWLGNDETHYVRKWEDKELEDLKKLIALTLHWIEVEVLTAEVIADMPDGKA